MEYTFYCLHFKSHTHVPQKLLKTGPALLQLIDILDHVQIKKEQILYVLSRIYLHGNLCWKIQFSRQKTYGA